MIYDKLPVALLSALTTEPGDSTNALIARYILEHMGEAGSLSVRELAAACNVGVGTVSRFAKDVGFKSFSDLRASFAGAERRFERADGKNPTERIDDLLRRTQASLSRAAHGLDLAALERLVDDLVTFPKVSAFGMLKAQAAALELQVSLLMQTHPRHVGTHAGLAEQLAHISSAGKDELVVVFSYTAGYFESVDLATALRRMDRPKIWLVCGRGGEAPSFVADRLAFPSDLGQFGHPYQLQLVASIIAQEYAARTDR
jgi:DNA-binding MurR/RpiR family transcriptional regulator